MWLKTYLLAALAAGGVFTGLASGGDDKTPPELKMLQFTPATIDASASAAEVTLSFSVTDDASGVTYVEASFVDSSGTFRQSASAKFAPTTSATKSAKITFPRFSNSGTWTLSHVFLSDADGNTLVLDNDALIKRGFPTRLEVVSVRDTVPPKLTSLEFAPAEIDTSSGPAHVKVNFTATDDLSGVHYIELGFVSPSGAARRNGSAKFEPAAGSVSNSITLTFPPLSEAGQWTLSTVFLADAAGNTLVLNTEGIVGLGCRTALQVKSTPDSTPPSLAALHLASDAIDTSQREAMVYVEFMATDDLSGVNHIELSFLSPSGLVRHGGTVKVEPAKSVSGRIPVTFPQHSEPGQWILNAMFLSDAAGNTLTLDADALASKIGKLQVR